MFLESITSEIISIIAQICVVILSTYGAILIGKVQKKIEMSKKKDETEIVNKITDEAVVSVEMENPDLTGEEKKQKAVEKSKEILSEKGVKVSDAHIEQSIEDGVFKMNVSRGKYTEDKTEALRQDILDGSEEMEEPKEEVTTVTEKSEKSSIFAERLSDLEV